MRTLVLITAALVLPLALPGPADAGHCEPSSDPGLGVVEFSAGDGRVFYLADAGGEWVPGPVHLYEETNGFYVPGEGPAANLQRDYVKYSDLVPNNWYPCSTHELGPDTLFA